LCLNNLSLLNTKNEFEVDELDAARWRQSRGLGPVDRNSKKIPQKLGDGASSPNFGT